MTRPRLIATDLDGTLIGADYVISPRTAAVLRRAYESGALVVLVTGRPARWLPQVYAQLDAHYPTVCSNGAVIYEPDTDTLRDARALSVEILLELCTRLRAEVPDVVFAAEVDAGRRMCHDPGWPLRWETAGDPTISPVTAVEMVGLPAVKLLAHAGLRDPDGFTALVAAAISGLAEVTHSSRSGLAEISASGVTKASGLATIAREFGVDAADVLAFGDMPNDVPMLSWAGRSVAMANAHPAVRAAATDLTLSNLDDGVAAYLERHFAP